MKAQNIFKNLDESFIYMERYVNNGSPSGWTKKKSTSLETHPFLGKEFFSLLEFDDSDLETIIIGEPHSFYLNNVNYAHLDSRQSENLTKSNRHIVDSSIVVSPTSGGRTMYVRKNDFKGFIKLTYDVNRIGRVDRQLSKKHCLSSVEVSNYIKEKIDNGKFPETFSVLLERSSKVTNLVVDDKIYEWGTIIREIKPYPYCNDCRQIVPGFSLFGKDYFNTETLNDDYLINQFIELSGKNPKEYLFDVVKMTIDSWFNTLLNCAFILELHGQNCYYEIDENFVIKRIVIKDMDSVDKDMTLAEKFGLKVNWESYPYECFYTDFPEDHPWYYKIRHSYMYDFKLGTYLLLPLISTVCEKFNLSQESITAEIVDYVRKNYLNQIPNGYLPNGKWYNCDNSERKPGERRKYFEVNNPLYR